MEEIKNDQPSLNRTAIKLPTFWDADAAAWFRRVEAQFSLNGISSQQTQYDHVLAVLPQEVVMRVRNACMNPPATDMYDYLKYEILRVYDLSNARRASALINLEPLGDRLPTQLLSQIQSLRGDMTIDDIIRAIFLERMPRSISNILRAMDDAPLEQIAAAADRMLSVPTKDTGLFNSHEDEIQAVSSPKFSFNKSSSSSRDAKKELCYYHSRFGKKARRCTQPCSWQGNDRVGSY